MLGAKSLNFQVWRIYSTPVSRCEWEIWSLMSWVMLMKKTIWTGCPSSRWTQWRQKLPKIVRGFHPQVRIQEDLESSAQLYPCTTIVWFLIARATISPYPLAWSIHTISRSRILTSSLKEIELYRCRIILHIMVSVHRICAVYYNHWNAFVRHWNRLWYDEPWTFYFNVAAYIFAFAGVIQVLQTAGIIPTLER